MSAGVYVPDNAALRDVLTHGQGFRTDHALLFLHFICAKRWMGDTDRGGFVRLNSRTLREWIQPRALSALQCHLSSVGVVETAPYSAGHFATGFRIATAFDGPPARHVIGYPPLAARLADWRREYRIAGDQGDDALAGVMGRRRTLLDHQRESLTALSLPATPAALVEMLNDQADPDHIAYVSQCIAQGDYDGLTIDAFGWRLHSLPTRTSSALRPLLLLDGRPVAEVDVANSQPLLLGILPTCADHRSNAPHIKHMHHIMEGVGAGFLCLGAAALPSVASADLHSFRDACEDGTLYDVLAADCGISRTQAKKELFRDVLFGKPFVCGKITRAFGQRWPSLLAWIQAAKRAHGYKTIAQALQRLESVIMLDGIGNRLLHELPGVPFLTIHDSAMLVADQAEAVRRIMVDEFARWGVKAVIRVKAGTMPERKTANEHTILLNSSTPHGKILSK